jgi:hypothetical protein
MENLTEKETTVYEAIKAGNVTTDSIHTAIEMKKATVATLLNSLVKKGIITKSDDGTVALVINENDCVQSTQNNNSNIVDPALSAIDITPTATGSEIPSTGNKNLHPAIDPNKYTLIIPYKKGDAMSSELRLALRTWAKHFPDINVVVVGDHEDWFSREIVFVEHTGHQTILECNGCQAPQFEQHPQADSTHKLLTAIAVLNLEGDIILSNDDIFILRDITFEDITTPRYYGQLRTDLASTSKYNQAQLRTANALKEMELSTVRYGTHTPIVLDAQCALTAIDMFKATDKGYLFSSLYFNMFIPSGDPQLITGGKNDLVLASIYRAGISEAVLQDVRNNRLFMNCNNEGWPSVLELLRRDYKEKSKYEL